MEDQEYGISIPAVSSLPVRAKLDRANAGYIERAGKGRAEFDLCPPPATNSTLP